MRRAFLFCAASLLWLCFCGCGTLPIKQYYVLNYVPSAPQGRLSTAPYPIALRVRELDIEDAYSRSQIVYRQSPFELRYYFYKVWAVKPNRMITDLVVKHLSSINFVSHLVKRYDEGISPDYELSGNVEAIEEYDSDQLWFAHLAIRLTLTRTSDGRVMYSRLFDNRKRVFQYSPDNVVREMSLIVEFIMDQAIRDMDVIFSKASGAPVIAPTEADSGRLMEIRKFRTSGGE